MKLPKIALLLSIVINTACADQGPVDQMDITNCDELMTEIIDSLGKPEFREHFEFTNSTFQVWQYYSLRHTIAFTVDQFGCESTEYDY